MTWVLKFGLLACCTALGFMMLSRPNDLFVTLFVAPTIGMIGCVLLTVAAARSVMRPARETNTARAHEGSQR